MGLFSKKKTVSKKEKEGDKSKLPPLPDLPDLGNYTNDSQIKNTLPQFPNNTLGNNVSQDIIKYAVSGQKESDEEQNVELEERPQGSNEASPTQYTRPAPFPVAPVEEYPSMAKKQEPIFVQIDKFNKAMEAIGDLKEKTSEMYNLLKEIKNTKQKEEQELNSWENEIEEIKKQLDQVDRDIFSGI